MSELTDILVGKNLKNHLMAYEGHSFKGNMTLCPFHEDTNASLDVSQKNGSGVWFCHSCGKGGNLITYVMKKDGLSTGDAVEKLARIYGLETGKSKPVVMNKYPYSNEKGKVLYSILRFKPKTFKADRKMDDIRQVLYDLPKVIKAKAVWIVEGEKDAINLQKLGITATTSPFGLSNWKPEFSKSLKGKRVRICLDVGTSKEAHKRAESILKAGAQEVKIIDLPGLEKTGEDISDWIEMLDSKTNEELIEQLKMSVLNTPIYKSSVKEQPVEETEPMSINMADVEEKETLWLWKNYIPLEAITLIFSLNSSIFFPILLISDNIIFLFTLNI